MRDVPASEFVALIHELAIVGAFLCASLMLAFVHVRVATRERWSTWLATAFAVYCAGFVSLAWLFLDADRAVRSSSLLIALAVILMTVGMWRYTALSGRSLDAHGQATIVLVLLALGGFTMGWVPGKARLPIAALIWSSWAVRFVRAELAEPKVGHVFIAMACATHPVLTAAAYLGWLPDGLQRVPGVLSVSVLGFTLLTTSAMRARQVAVQAQRAVQALNDSLEQKVHERTVALQETIDALEGFNRSVSHDLRGPLGSIASVANMVLRRVRAGELDAAEHLIVAMAEQAESSRQLVEGLLSLARSANATVHRTSVDTQQLVASVVQDLSRELDGASLPLKVESLPSVQADEALLRQVFRNLIGNALKFSRPQAEPLVTVRSGVERGQLVFEVADNGVGFETDQAERLFEPFVQAHGAQFAGDGIGLSIVKRIVLAHGGWIQAQGAPGQGAMFRFSLGDARGAGRAPRG